MNPEILKDTVDRLLIEGKGILAADESSRTADKRFSAAGIETTEEARRQYRQLLLTTPGAERYLTGVILYDETIRQSTDDNTNFAQYLTGKNILPGIKTDQGLVDIPGSQEQVSQGLDVLDQRNQEYFDLGARFAKWRSVIKIGEGLPTTKAIDANAKVLAEYAAATQASNIVPIIEPEVLLEGSHTIEQSQAVIEQVLQMVFKALQDKAVKLEYTILKTSMALPGADSGLSATPEEVATRTMQALRASVPAEIPGIVFLSGGQTPADATANLNAIAKLGPHPWLVTFSYSRALQDPVLKFWARNRDDINQAQGIFAKRLELAALAQQGKYSSDMEPEYDLPTESSTGQD